MQSTLVAEGGPDRVITDEALRTLVKQALSSLGARQKVLAIPPDFTRLDSRAGFITSVVAEHFGANLVDILPALGTHAPMSPAQVTQMFGAGLGAKIRPHDWRNDVRTVGTVSAERVSEITQGSYAKPWPAQLNRLLVEGGHDLILSIGQVVPHEVAGMANHAKNLFVGTGGKDGINGSHFVSAVWGIERTLGRTQTPVRQLLDIALSKYCSEMPIVFILTVVSSAQPGEQGDARGTVTRGVYVGATRAGFEQAAELARQVNFTRVPQPLKKVVAYLDPEEFHSTWLGNKAIYRTRMAIADEGELVVLAPGVRRFGEDDEIDQLIRKIGYRTSQEVLDAVREDADLGNNLSAAAHLIHGSSEGRFRITYATDSLSKKEVEGVGYQHASLQSMVQRYDPGKLRDGDNEVNGERVFFVSKPALGLWAHSSRLSE